MKQCPVTHKNKSVPAVLNEMKMAAVSGQLERVKDLYNSLLAAEETGA